MLHSNCYLITSLFWITFFTKHKIIVLKKLNKDKSEATYMSQQENTNPKTVENLILKFL